MRLCLRQQRTTLGPYRLSSRFRFLGTTATQPSWRDVVEKKNASVNALVYVAPDDGAPVPQGPLSGTTVAVKDNICTKNMPTTCSSAMLRGKLSGMLALPRAPRGWGCGVDFYLCICHSTKRLPIAFRRDRRPPAERVRRDDHRKDKLRRIRHGVPIISLARLSSLQHLAAPHLPNFVF